jgi:hypothetical protein
MGKLLKRRQMAADIQMEMMINARELLYQDKRRTKESRNPL